MTRSGEDGPWAIPFVKALVKAPGRSSVLLQIRGKDDRYRGRLELPGGKIRLHESSLQALAREVREETGLEVSRVLTTSIDRVDRFAAAARATRPLAIAEAMTPAGLVVGQYFACEATGSLRDTAEGSAHRWLVLDQLYRELEADPEQFATLDRAALAAIDSAWLREWLSGEG